MALPAPNPVLTLPGGKVTVRKVLADLAMRLKALRKERGWTQPDLARRAGLSAGYIARLETGRHDPKLSTLVRLAKALRRPVTELLG
jgi:transcriptional regulator with XRE-family HTH domain